MTKLIKYIYNVYSDRLVYTKNVEILNEYFTSVLTYNTTTPLLSISGSPFPDLPLPIAIYINCEGVKNFRCTYISWAGPTYST